MKLRTKDPQNDSESINKVIFGLESELSKYKTDLLEKSHYLSNNSIEIVALKSKVSSLLGRISTERSRLISDKSSDTQYLFETQKISTELALEAYKASIANHAQLLNEAQKNSRIVLIISSPSKPEEPSFPKPIELTLKLMLISAFVLAICSMFAATILRSKK